MNQENIGGNYYDKYNTKNPIARYLVDGFLRTFDELTASSEPMNVFEIGCGEGNLSKRLADKGHRVRGADIEADIIKLACERFPQRDNPLLTFDTQSIYDIAPESLAHYDLVICCEIFEHLPDPKKALAVLYNSGAHKIVTSVPREPLWRVLNVARCKYVKDLGNTPGHLNHWSSAGFLDFVKSRFSVDAIRRPIPWTFLSVSAFHESKI